MASTLRFLIIDGYPKASRDEFDVVGMKHAWRLYHEVARLILARAPKLVAEGFFQSHEDLVQYVEKLETLHQNPTRKDVRWQLNIDDDVLSDQVRQVEFRNWINKLVLPRAR
jgi:hypothetical protein